MKKGFTLAEMLIVISIIGIVAETTIPTLINDFQKQVTVTTLKETYSILAQVVQMSSIDNGQPTSWDWSGTSYTDAGTTPMVKKYILPYLKVLKDCGYDWKGECVAPKSYYTDGAENVQAGYQIILANGVHLTFLLEPNLLDIFVDLNGSQKPNRWGKDIFVFNIFNDTGLNPRNYGHGFTREGLLTDGDWGCSKATGWMKGFFCAELIMTDGWRIGDGYPW